MKFSIITPVWNCEESVVRTAQSVEMQEYSDFEHILIDNCSTDGTIEIALRINPAIRVFSEKDTGVYDAFNKGWRKADGDIIAFLNADDHYVSDDILLKVSEVFKSDDSVDCVYGNIIVNGREHKPKAKGALSINGMRIFHPAVFMKKRVFEALDGFDESFPICADLDLFIRAAGNGFNFRYIDIPIADFALGGLSTMHLFNVTKDVINVLRKNGFSNSFIVKFATLQYSKDMLNLARRALKH